MEEIKLSKEHLAKIKSLREKTGCSIAACKSSLVTKNWNEEEAIEHLKEFEMTALAAKKMDRDTKEGVFAAAIFGKNFVYARVGSETDFSIQCDFFSEMCKKILKGIEEDNKSVIEDAIKEGIAASRENIVLGENEKIITKNPYFYLHSTGMSNKPEIGAILGFVDLENEDAELGKNLSIHLVAFKPKNIEEFLDQVYIKDSSKTIKQIVVNNKILNFICKY